MEQDFLDDPVNVYLAAVVRTPPMNRTEEHDCIRQIRAGSDESETVRERLFEANLALVVSIAKQFKNSNLHILDLIQKGNEGLLNAIRSLEKTDQNDFTLIATEHVQRAMEQAIAAGSGKELSPGQHP